MSDADVASDAVDTEESAVAHDAGTANAPVSDVASHAHATAVPAATPAPAAGDAEADTTAASTSTPAAAAAQTTDADADADGLFPDLVDMDPDSEDED